jgi:Dolichyl-phosphate-mannose-protein mannosyltransferase
LKRGIVLVLLLSGLLKVVLAVAFADVVPRFDEAEFLELGRRVAAGGMPALWRAPGYPSFVAAGLALAGGRVVGVRLLQVLLSVATTFLVYRVGRRLGGGRAALAAAAFVAFYPSHVALSHLLWSETLFLFLTTFAFDRLLSGDGRPSARAAAVAGVLLGAASLVRSVGVALAAASAAWLLVRAGRRSAALRAFGIAAVVVIAPWSLQASLRAGRFVLIDTNPGWNLWSGNNEYVAKDLQGIWGTGLRPQNGLEEAWGPRLEARGIPADFAGARLQGEWRREVGLRLTADGIMDRSGPDADDWYRRAALAEMRRDPGGVILRIPRKLAGFWAPDFFLPRHLLRDWYGECPPALAAVLVALTWLAAAVPLLLGPVALFALRGGPFRSLALAWIGTYVAVHAIVFGVSRMHQPLVPLLVLAAALALLGERAPGGEAPRWHRGAAAGVVALSLGVLSLPVVVGVYVLPGPRHLATARALAAVRHLPLPGTRHATWMLAELEAARGRDDAAMRILDDAPAGDPGTRMLRALCAPDPGDRARWAQSALAARPRSELLRTLVRLEGAP